MALVASLFAVLVGVSAAATISPDSEAPVRRMAKAEPASLQEVAKAVPVSLEEVAADDEGEGDQEELSLSALHKGWPHCQALPEHNWGGMQGAAQHLQKMTAVRNVNSSLECGRLCGGYTYTHNGVHVPCASWAWVEKEWAHEFGGFKSCAMFGFMQNDAGVVRFPVSEYTYKNHCCTAGTPCKNKETITGYSVSHDQVAAAYRKAERGRRGREKKERIAAARAGRAYPTEEEAERTNAEREGRQAKSSFYTNHRALIIIASVLGLCVIGGVCAWKVGYAKM